MWGALEKKQVYCFVRHVNYVEVVDTLHFSSLNLFDKLCPETAIYLFSSKCLICNLFSGRHFKRMRYEFVM